MNFYNTISVEEKNRVFFAGEITVPQKFLSNPPFRFWGVKNLVLESFATLKDKLSEGSVSGPPSTLIFTKVKIVQKNETYLIVEVYNSY